MVVGRIPYFFKCEHCREMIFDHDIWSLKIKELTDKNLRRLQDDSTEGNHKICCPKCGKELSKELITDMQNSIKRETFHWAMLLT